MTRAALALLALTSPALSDTCFYGSQTAGTRVTIQPHDEAFAELVIDNRLSFRSHATCDLTIYGQTVQVLYDPADNLDPDWFFVTTPPTLRADPPQILVDDRDTASVLLWMTGEAGS